MLTSLQYCGKKCQVAHWPEHKKDCQSDLMKETWQPAWEREGREPAFLGPTLPGMLGQVKFGSLARSKYLWGNMPAFDLVQLKTNEGADYDKPLSLLFAGMVFVPVWPHKILADADFSIW